LSEQALPSPPAQYRLSERQFYRPKNPTNNIKVLMEDKNYTQKNNMHTHTHTK